MTYNRSNAVPSPCVRVCALDAAEMCSGCGRTLDEIARWARMSDSERQIVKATADARLQPRAATG